MKLAPRLIKLLKKWHKAAINKHLTMSVNTTLNINSSWKQSKIIVHNQMWLTLIWEIHLIKLDLATTSMQWPDWSPWHIILIPRTSKFALCESFGNPIVRITNLPLICEMTVLPRNDVKQNLQHLQICLETATRN